jgi:hypothetical protein
MALMVAWREIEGEAADLATAVADRLRAHRHHTLATLRSDGSPRISGTEVELSGGELWLGSMPGAVKAMDLRRDPRFALHTATVDPPQHDPREWPGEAKIAGRAVEESPADGSSHRFRLDVEEVVLTRISSDGSALEITSWHPGRGVEVRRRA